MSGAYYNEIDPLKAETLREAIKAGAIAPGEVDERSIEDVESADLLGFTQCHFFAGGGFWSLAARLAGWPDDRPLWTGSCPCPSFSAAGKGRGFDDPRHLWPHWDRLIDESRPPVIFGEQADDAIGFGWLDLVQTDLEAKAYSVGAVVFGAHSVGAPHIRQRLYFCADTESIGRSGRTHDDDGWRRKLSSGHSGEAGERTDTDGGQSGNRDVQRRRKLGLFAPDRGTGDDGDASQRRLAVRRSAPRRAGHSSLASESGGGQHAIGARLEGQFGDVREWRGPGWLDPEQARSIAEAGATRGFWADCDWWYGRDGKYRPIGPGLFPLAHGSAGRVGRLRMYGDAICVEAAQAFIESYIEVRR